MHDADETGFDWLREERAGLKAQVFHVFENRDWQTRGQGEDEGSHESFLRAFGESSLYRNGFGAHVLVHRPRHDSLCEKIDWPTPVLHLASSTSQLLFAPVDDLQAGRPETLLALTLQHHTIRPSPLRMRFDSWLRARAISARKRYSRRAWRLFAEDPPPFTKEEESILEAREAFDWKVTRALDHGGRPEDCFTISNRSRRSLGVFTVGVKRGSWIGAKWLDVSGISPGETAEVRRPVLPGYDKYGPEDYCNVPRPLPEQRDLLRELHPDWLLS